MKRLLLLTTIAILALNKAIFAQCTPDPTITQPGIYPDTLPVAIIGVPYSEVLQVRVLADTSGFPVQSISIDNVLGMPPGFSYQCVPSNCVFPGGSNGCVVFSGTAPAGSAGQYPLQVIITSTVVIIVPISQTDTLNDYIFTVVDPASVQNVNPKSLEVNQNFPNPAINKTAIDFVVPNSTVAELKIFNVIGKEILAKKYNAKPGKNTIELDVREFEDGLYMYSLKTGNAVITRRMVIGKTK